MSGLHVAADLELPLDMVTEPIGILANRGRGKSYTTHVLVEEIHNADVPVVVLDVKGDWWGLRSLADGKSDGLPFYIFGGDHADLPLEPTAGELLADLVVDERVSVVLDLSHMSKTKARSFTVAFAERLYHRNRDPLFVVVDEADVLIPQRATAETARLLGAMEDIAKRGRGRGIGMAVVTQRPQEVAKSVLDLMDTLILLGMTGPRSLKSISEWISAHVDEDTTAADVLATLPSLPVGNAWVWSPMQKLLQRIAVRQIETFDSHVTPKPGQKRIAPRSRVALDLDALGERITATVERAKADDPRVLRARIRELEHQVDQLQAAPTPDPVVELIKVPLLDPEWREAFSETADQLLERFRELDARLLQYPNELPTEGKQGQPTTRSSAPRANQASGTTGRAPVARPSTTEKKPSPGHQRDTRPATDPGEAPTPARLLILATLASLESIRVPTPPKSQVALFAGVSPKSSGYQNNLGALRTAGLLDYPAPGLVQLTDAGRAHVSDSAHHHLATTEALHDKLRGLLAPARWRILEPLLEVYPDAMDKSDLAEHIDVSARSSGYQNNLGALRSLGLVDYPATGLVAATSLLFVDG